MKKVISMILSFTVATSLIPTTASAATVTGDLNGDGKVDAKDLKLMQDYLAKKINHFPIDDIIVSIDDVKASVNQGVNYSLPGTVTATMYNGSKKQVSVKWDNKANTSKAGVFSFKGTVSGYSKKVNLTLTVAGTNNGLNRSNPLSLNQNQKFTLQNYSFDNPRTIELQLMELHTGADANSIVASENMFNDKPKSDEQWILMKFKLKYVSGSDETLEACDVVNDNFYSKDGASAPVISTAAFSGARSGQSIDDVTLYTGGSNTFWYGVLVKKSYGTPLIRIGTGYDSSKYQTIYKWFSLN